MEITIVRHAQASYGAADYDRLSALGHQQARWLGEHLARGEARFDRVFMGTLRRHRETSQGIAATLALPEIVEDPRWNELDYDRVLEAYQRVTGTETPSSRTGFLRLFPENIAAWAEEELADVPESFAAFEARVHGALAALPREGRSLVVTSGGVIGVLMRKMLGLPVRTMADLILNVHNASVHSLVLEDGRWRLSQFNALPHLDHPERAHARTYI